MRGRGLEGVQGSIFCSDNCDMVILNEVNNAASYGLPPLNDLVSV
jgi:ATP:corrinoid adenosyltransferase